jgi:hypothetical protein
MDAANINFGKDESGIFFPMGLDRGDVSGRAAKTSLAAHRM